MKTKTARCSQVLWIAVTIGFALGILLAKPQTAAAQGPWLVSPSPTPTNNIYYNAGNVGIGTNAPDQKLVVSANSATTLPASVGNIQLFGANGVQPIAAIDGFAAAPLYLLRRANNTAVSPSAVQANDLMGAFGVAGYGSTAYQGTRARIGFFASENWTNSANGTYMAFNTTASGAATAGGTERMRIDSAGNVGIGTTTPVAQLDVRTGTVALPPGGGLDPNNFHTWFPYTDGKNYIRGTTIIADLGGNVLIGNPTPSGNKLDVAGTINATGLIINGAPITAVATTGSAADLSSGTVGIARLGNSGTASTTTFLRGDNTWQVPSGATQWNSGGSSSIYYSGGNVGIGTATAPSDTLEVSGTLKVSGTGNITAAGTIEGYNIKAKFQDVAEWVPSSERILAGTVVVLDTTKSNQVIASTQAYDTRVAGVVSEQPGIALGESGEGKVLVATTGRVLVKVDATKGPIHIGDLLVTSDVPGLAMKSEPIEVGGHRMHMPATLIGKALEPLEKGSGKILVLLSLQ